MAHLELKNLEKVFSGKKGRDFHAVKGIDLAVDDGEFMVLLGPSGCGKSTTLRMIAGLEEATAGTIEIDREVVNGKDPKDRDVAMVFQNFALYPHMTVFENMAFGLKLRKHSRSEIEGRIQKAAEMLEIGSLLDRRPKSLSGGQRQRVAVGRAIVREPKIFLFDEPLSNLDARMRASMRTQISRLHRQLETTMVFVTHDQMEAMTMGDRICVMNEGEIVQIDTPMKIYHEPANTFVASFIGNPPMNLINGELIHSNNAWRFRESEKSGVNGFEITLSDQSADLDSYPQNDGVVLGIRAENMSLLAPNEVPLSEGVMIKGTTQMVETMGSDSIVYIDTGINELAVSVRGSETPSIDEEIRVAVDQKRIQFFSPGSGKAISSFRER